MYTVTRWRNTHIVICSLTVLACAVWVLNRDVQTQDRVGLNDSDGQDTLPKPVPVANDVLSKAGEMENAKHRDQESLLQGPLASNENWKTHRNEKYGFKFQHPESATLYSPPGSRGGTLLSETAIEVGNESEDAFYNLAVVDLSVYTKGSYQHYPQSNTERCEIYRRYTRTYGGKEADIVEQADCPGSEGSPIGWSGHTVTVIISLSETEDLVFFANLGNPLIKESALAEKILSTLTFTN